MKYSEQLKMAEWKKKCHQIRMRDKNRCTYCGSGENLCVHHTFYYSDRPLPWLYPDNSLVTLCKKCHNKYHEFNESVIYDRRTPKKIRMQIIKKPRKKKKGYLRTRPLCLAEIQEQKGIMTKKRKETG